MMSRSVGAIATLVLACSLVEADTRDSGQDPPALGKRRVILSGCVVAGEKRDTYLLMDLAIENPRNEGIPVFAMYRLNTDRGLREHVGHRVQVTGIVDFRESHDGKVIVANEGPGDTTLELKARGGNVEAKVDPYDASPLMVGTSGKVEAAVPSYKMTVRSVERLPRRCQ